MFLFSQILNLYFLRKKKKIVFDSHFKPLYTEKCCRDIISNRADSPICGLDNKKKKGISV